MQKKEDKTLEIVGDLVHRLDQEKLNPAQLINVLSTLLYSVGVSLEDCGDIPAEKVLTNFARNPTLGSALMAQALHMKETWTKDERNETDD